MARNLEKQDERCAICGCLLNRRKGKYGKQSLLGRAHASKHQYVAERFFGRSGNRKGTRRLRLFEKCPWGLEGEYDVFCYECHEILLHNPVFTRENILVFADLVKQKELNEARKNRSNEKLGRRVQLQHEVIELGLRTLKSKSGCNP